MTTGVHHGHAHKQMRPVAHVPVVLGILRRLEIATVIACLIPPSPAHRLTCRRGVEAVGLTILDGHRAYAMPTPWLHQDTATMRCLRHWRFSAARRSRWRNFVINS
jgi:hypothetical protein